MLKWSNEDRPISEIREWSKNPRIIGGKKFEDLITSMDRFGYVDQIVINTDGELIGGHARLQKLKQDGETSVSVRTPDRKLNEAEFSELAIRLNKNIAGEWDFDALLKDFDSGDLTDWGFDDLEFGAQEIADPELKDGDREPIQQITFTLADEQAQFIQQKIAEIKKTDEYKFCETYGNENSNGNALYCLLR